VARHSGLYEFHSCALSLEMSLSERFETILSQALVVYLR